LATGSGGAGAILRAMDGRDDDFTPAQWEIIGELCRLHADAMRGGRSPTPADAARVFRILRETPSR
jgi:hypothetical protein